MTPEHPDRPEHRGRDDHDTREIDEVAPVHRPARLRHMDERTVETGSERLWSPAQIVAAVLGLAFVVLGGVTLLRAGLSDLLATVTVGWYGHTALLGIVEVVLGLLFLSAAASAVQVRTSSISIGVAMIAFAMISLIEPGGMSRWVGDPTGVGWTYLVAGLVAALVGVASPVVSSQRHRRVDTGL